jgi:hypothetical protein
MQRSGTMQRLRSATWKTWLVAVLAAWLLFAESFALTHDLDASAHANGQSCAVCVSLASFGAGAVSVPMPFEPVIAASFVVAAAGIVFLSTVPTRRYARGPPTVSFTL